MRDAATVWGLAGVVLIFLNAIVRLAGRGVASIRAGLEPVEWLVLLGLTVLFVYTEGVRALQRRYVPHLVRRLEAVRTERRVLVRVLAPLQALSLIAAPRRTLVRAWAGLFAILAAVLIVRSFPEPWRGIVDLAVAFALAWGLVAILVAAPRALRS